MTTDTIAVLDQLNRDLVALRWKHRNKAEEAYPGQRGELRLILPHVWEERMATCDHENAIAMGIDLARELVLRAREEMEEPRVIH